MVGGCFIAARSTSLGVLQRAQLDLQPGEAAVDGLVDGRRRIDRFAVAPHPLVPTFAKQLVGLLDHRLALGPHLGRLRGQDVGHRACLAELLVQSLAVAAGQGRRVMLRGHPDALVFKRE